MAENRRSNKKRKAWRTILIILAVLLAGVAVAVKVLQQQVTENYASGGSADVSSAEVTVGSISITVSGSGTLAKEDTTDVTLPVAVTLNSIEVEEGDTVEAGQLLASLNSASVLEAMAALQDELDALDAEIAEAGSDTVSSSVKTKVAGRVKLLYAQAGDAVSTVMSQYGALAELSLDGYMAVDVETALLSKGQTVSVTLDNEKTYAGLVESVSGGKAVVLLTDDGPLYGAAATVATESGETVGTGTLYIHKALKITGYAGTVKWVYAAENRKVSANATLFSLTDTSYTAKYETLLKERQALEEELQELLALYKAGALYAPIGDAVETLTEEADSDTADTEFTFVSICPNENMTVSVSVDESDILSLELGQEASVTVSSIGDDAYTGTVTAIESSGTSSNGVSSYAVEVTVEKDGSMRTGMSASVSIKIEGVDGALLVPEDAVTKTRSASYVYTSVDETTGELSGMVEVTTGLSGGGYIEITEGLSEGDTVYYTESESTDFSGFSAGFSMGGGTGSSGSSGMPSGGNMGGGDRGSGSAPGQMPGN